MWTPDGIVLREFAVPELAAGEVLVRITLATVCGSDLHTVSGRRSAPCPSVLGHEAVGEVVALGGGADPVVVGDEPRTLTEGDRIVWSVTVPCLRCSRCRSDFTAKCVDVRKVGHESAMGPWALSGSYAQHIVLPHGTAVALVPDTLPDAVAAPAACATATVMAALEAAGAVEGKRVLIIGAGMLGVTASAAAADRGASVSLIDRDPLRQKRSQDFGAREDDGDSVDRVVDFSGAAAPVQAAIGRLDTGGRLVLAGSVSPGPPITVDPEAIVRQWLTITGVHNYEPRHLAQAIVFLDSTREKYQWAELIDTPVPLADLGRVLRPTPPGILRSSVAP